MIYSVHAARKHKPSKIKGMQEAGKKAGEIGTEIRRKNVSTGQSHRKYSEVKYQAFLNGGQDK